MSFVDSLKKGLFGSEDDYDDQYMDDGPQMVNNNNGLGVAGNEEEDEPEEGAAPKRNGKVVNIHATTQLKVVLVKPEHFEDASTIAFSAAQRGCSVAGYAADGVLVFSLHRCRHHFRYE